MINMKKLLIVALALSLVGCTTTYDARRMRREGKSQAYNEVHEIIMRRAEALIATGDLQDKLQAIALMQVAADVINLRIKLIDDIWNDR